MKIEYYIKYKIAVDLIKKGYLIHCTDEEFNSFNPSYIKGGMRAKEGYGFYFTDMPYKPIEYDSIFKVVKKSDFSFLDAMSPIDLDMFNNNIQIEIYKLENILYQVKNIKEYNNINQEIEFLKEKLNKIGNDDFYYLVKNVIKQNNLTNIGSIEYYIPNPEINIPKLINLYQYYGYDGYEYDGIYTIFNFNKLNKLVKTVDTSKYINNNITESFDLNSFKIQSSLNPKIWENNRLNSRVRLKLLDIADDFTDFLNVDWVKPDDIIITGSIANYNWSTKYSDIDLHIVFDFEKIDKRVDFVKNYFDAKKNVWNNEHKNIKIFGFDVEVYVQDKNEKHTSSGIYSLEKNKWIVEPEKMSELKKSELKKSEQKAKKFSKKIDNILNKYKSNSTETQKEEIINNVNSVIKKLKNFRKDGFDSEGEEMNPNNIIFKMLRRNGDIEKLYNKKREIYDDLMSINEGCWGYGLFDNDDTLDKRNIFIKDILNDLISNLNKANPESTGSGSDKFSWAVLLYDFLIKNKEEGFYLDEYKTAVKKCIAFFNEYKSKTDTYSEPEKMKKTIEKSINTLKKCISKD